MDTSDDNNSLSTTQSNCNISISLTKNVNSEKQNHTETNITIPMAPTLNIGSPQPNSIGSPQPNSTPTYNPDVGQYIDPDVVQYIDPDVGQYIDPDLGQYIDPDVGPNIDPYIREEHRIAFNVAVFGNNLEGTKQRSAQMSNERYQQIVQLILGWHQEDKAAKKKFRSENRQGYEKVTKYTVTTSILPDGTASHELRRREIGDNDIGRLVIPKSQIFDAIYDVHNNQLSHLKSAATHKNIQDRYCNITLQHCNQFIRLCPTCNKQQPSLKARKGAEQPIMSHRFRDRFQVDLIDMTTKPAINIYNITMRWILTMKDHFTGFTTISAIPRKRPIYVANELNIIFGIIGYPMIFHTDNGKEFTAKLPLLPEDLGNLLTKDQWKDSTVL
jgi:hypothetical protein